MITEIITNVGLMAALSIVGAEYLSKLTKFNGFAAQVQSWVVSVVLAAFASYLGIGIFPHVSLFAILLYGLLIGLVANGVFEIPFTKTVLTWIKARFAPKPTVS